MNKERYNDMPGPGRREFLKTGSVAASAMLLGAGPKVTPASAAEQAQDKHEKVQWLFVQNAEDAVLKENKLTLKKVSRTTLFFSDRPKRIAGHIMTREFVDDWGEGEDSFAVDPPNAVLSTFGSEEIVDSVVELKNPRLIGQDLVYEIVPIEKEGIPKISGPCSLFIDPLGRPMTPISIAGRHRRRRRRVVRHRVIH